MGGLFADETAVRAVGGAEGVEGGDDGVAHRRYAGEIAAVWNLVRLPQGGIVTALALRAMAAELAHPEQRLRTLHTTFAAQVAHGPVDVDVEVLRRGRSMSHLRAEVRNPGAPRGHLTTAVFGSPREGFAFTDLRPPAEVPAPDDCPSFRDPPPPEAGAGPFEPMPFWDARVEGRPVLGHAPWEDYVPDRAERAMWYRFDEPPFLDDGTLDPLALVVVADTMPGAVGEKVGRQDRMWFAPSVDLTVHLLDDCRSPWVLAHNRARHAGDGYASADMALWDCGPAGTDAPRLVAYATQLFLFSFLR
ncbi:MAG TPA: thioesterase family protein [Acidimicrobiales bacterium]